MVKETFDMISGVAFGILLFVLAVLGIAGLLGAAIGTMVWVAKAIAGS
jgi:hypothetical protein